MVAIITIITSVYEKTKQTQLRRSRTTYGLWGNFNTEHFKFNTVLKVNEEEFSKHKEGPSPSSRLE